MQLDLQVDTGSLNDGASELKNVMYDIQSIGGNLGSAVHTASSGWQGESKGAFEDMWNRWSSAIGQLATALEQTASHLNEAASAYQETDHTAVKIEP